MIDRFGVDNLKNESNIKICKELSEAYNKTSKEIIKVIEGYENLIKFSPTYQQKTCNLTLQEVRFLKFCYTQTIDTFQPANFIASNPEVLEATASTLGENLKNGAKNLLNDIEKSPDFWPQISTTQENAFTIGAKIACTEGAVVFRNKMFVYDTTQLPLQFFRYRF